MLKGAYLKRLTSSMRFMSVNVGKRLEGSSPPSVFIGAWDYPYVYAGPMLTPFHGNTSILDAPEVWVAKQKTTEEIVNFRLNLIRGRQRVGIRDLDNRLIEKLQEISLADASIESEAEFRHHPRGISFSDDHLPFGPSALIDKFYVGNCRWDSSLEKVYYDSDLKAADAVIWLYRRGLPFSRIQKAFSVGTMGIGKRRRLVPTRWSLTACDSILADSFLEEVRHYEMIEHYQVYEFYNLHNYFAVLLIPGAWQYEWLEAFVNVMENEELIFSDCETNKGKKGYSCVGGCYYSCKFALLEGLARERKQAGAIVFREAHKGYVPLGVFNVRENVRAAMKQTPVQFDKLKPALAHIEKSLRLPLSAYIAKSTLLKGLFERRQTIISQAF